MANGIKQSCRQRSTTAQQRHLPRLVKHDKRVQKAVQEYSVFAKEERLQMLQELLELQEVALGLIETSMSPSGPQHEETPLTEEAAHEFTEELRRIIYTRRNQVFSSKHLRHCLREVEAGNSRGMSKLWTQDPRIRSTSSLLT